MILSLIVALLVSVGALYLTAHIILKNIHKSDGTPQEVILEEIKKSEAVLAQFTKNSEQYASKLQLETLLTMISDVSEELKKTQSGLKELEKNLEQRQEVIENKETQQQDLKSISSSDEEKIKQLLAAYAGISQSAIKLEHRISDILNKLDKLNNKNELSADEKDIADNLSNALRNGGALIRDLITEYSNLNGRIEQTTQQQLDLEKEYTRLVEQQLGE